MKLFVSGKGSEVRKNLLLSLVKDDRLELKDAEKLLNLLGDTFNPLKIENNVQEISGETTVTHDGSTEDCTQRLSIQQCHLRVILEIYDGSSLVSQEVLFDETFNTNSVTVNFSYSPSIDENGYNFELRLETDQIRDWHKPETFWFVKY